MQFCVISAIIIISNMGVGDFDMAASYKKLWKLLIDKDMRKEDLRVAAGITTTAMAKLGRNEDVKTSVLIKICNVLQCDISDIMEVIIEKKD